MGFNSAFKGSNKLLAHTYTSVSVMLRISSWRNSPQWATASSLLRLQDHTQKHNNRQDSSARVISPSLKPLPDNTQHKQQTDILTPGDIRTRNPSKRAAANPRLRLYGTYRYVYSIK